jgi:DNA polymerase-3 subunit gamma/tau
MLYEKYRPTTWAEFIGQPKVVERLRRVTERAGWDRDAIWLSGGSGCGKSSAALIIARQVATDLFIDELDGDKCNVQAVRDLERVLGLSAPNSWRVVIVNEAHAMSRQAVQAWLTLLERLPLHALIIFTTTQEESVDLFGDFTAPLLSRCKVFTFTNQGLAQVFAKRAREIALAENLDGKPEAAYVRLVQDCHNNMRAVLQRIEAAEMIG